MVRIAELWARPWGRRGLIALVVVALYAAAGFLLAPWLIERSLVSALDERLALQTEVGNLRLNPFSLSLTVDELRVTEEDGQPLLAFDRLYTNFQLSSLFRWAWSFDEIHLIRPALRFERTTETDNNFTALAERWAATGTDTPEPVAAEQAAESAAIPRLVIADLRIVEGRVTIIDQTAGGEPFDTELSPIDLELAEFSTLPDRSGRQQVTIRTESGAEIAWTGTLSVNPLALAGAVRLEGTYTPMLFRYFRDQLALPVSFDGGELRSSFDYRVAMDDQGEIGVVLENLTGTLTGLNVNQEGHPHLVELGSLQLEGGSLQWPEQVVRLERVLLADVLIRAFRNPDGSYLELPAASESATAPEDVAEAAEEGLENVAEDAESWQVDVAEITLSNWRATHTDLGIEDGVLALTDLNLTLENFALTDGTRMPLALSLNLDPAGTVRLEGELQLFDTPALTSTLTATDLAVAAVQPYLSSVANIGIDGGAVTLSGELSIDEDEPFRYLGDLQVASLSLIDRVQEEALFSWDLLAVDRLSATGAGLELSVLSIEAPYARVEIERDGSTNIERTLIERAPETEGASEGPPSETTAEPAGFHVTIGETRVSGGSARFTDLALPLPFEADVSNLEGKVTTFATNSQAPSEVDLQGQVNEYGALKIDGSISANDPTAATDITVDFDNVNLPRMTPYTVKFAGRAIADGRTDLTLSYLINEGQLEGNNRLVVRDLTLGEKVEQPGAMDLPLDMAVALLKDGEGNLDFSFPVSGSIDDPEFSYSGAVMKAFSNVIGGIVAAPFRLLGSLVGMAPDELEHIGFEPGDATITPPQRETLAKLADALSQRPQLILEVAPVQNPDADRLAIAERLLDTEIEAELALGDDDDVSHTDALRGILEQLYDATLPDRETILAEHTRTDEAGASNLDVPAYNAALREGLIGAREVPELDLNALALARLNAIQEALTALVPLPEERLRALPTEAVELNEDGLVQMSLNVTIAD